MLVVLMVMCSLLTQLLASHSRKVIDDECTEAIDSLQQICKNKMMPLKSFGDTYHLLLFIGHYAPNQTTNHFTSKHMLSSVLASYKRLSKRAATTAKRRLLQIHEELMQQYCRSSEYCMIVNQFCTMHGKYEQTQYTKSAIISNENRQDVLKCLKRTIINFLRESRRYHRLLEPVLLDVRKLLVLISDPGKNC